MSRVVPLLTQASRLRKAGDLAGAERFLRQAVQTEPSHAVAAHQLGEVLLEQRRAPEALAAFNQAVRLRPDFAVAHADRALALAAMSRPAEAESSLRTSLTIDPRLAGAWLNLGRLLISLRRENEAVAPLSRAIALAPKDSEAQLALATAISAGQCRTAALPHFRRAAELARTPATLGALAECLLGLSKIEEALSLLDEAAAKDARDPTLRATRARTLEAMGRQSEALAIYEELATGPDSNPVFISQFATSARGTDLGAKARTLLRNAISRISPNSPANVPLHYALGNYFEEDADFAGAFACFKKANDLLPQTFDERTSTAQTDDIIGSFSPERFARLPRSSRDDRSPVFIVGMPRSGTTLLERILGGHPDAAGVGELDTMPMLASSIPARLGVSTYSYRNLDTATPALMDSLADEYLASIRSLAPAARRVVDKMPHNFMHVGLIALILPGSSIIHNRRHPLDTCLSCYTTWLRTSHDYAVSLKGLASAYRDYHRLMRHWSSLMGDRIIDSVYEDTVADTEGSARRIINSIGLDWNDACLAFHSRSGVVTTASVHQVRKPIYASSKNRWKNYEPYIGELIDALRDLL